jgi:type II secretory pathway component PulF
MEIINNKLTSGVDLTSVLQQVDLFPEGYESMVSVGSKGGEFDRVFHETAQFYRRELESSTDFWIRAIEPLIFLIVASFVAFVVFSILIPLIGFNYGN